MFPMVSCIFPFVNMVLYWASLPLVKHISAYCISNILVIAFHVCCDNWFGRTHVRVCDVSFNNQGSQGLHCNRHLPQVAFAMFPSSCAHILDLLSLWHIWCTHIRGWIWDVETGLEVQKHHFSIVATQGTSSEFFQDLTSTIPHNHYTKQLGYKAWETCWSLRSWLD